MSDNSGDLGPMINPPNVRVLVAVLALVSLTGTAMLHSEILGILTGLLMAGCILWKRGLAS